MRLTIGSVIGRINGGFKCHAKTRGDHEVKYHMDYQGTWIGDVIKEHGSDDYLASADTGSAAGMRWFGGFKTRRDACLFLLGMQTERERPARHWRGLEAEPRAYGNQVWG